MQKQLTELETNMADQVAAQDRLRDVLTRRLDALKHAQHREVAELCEQENVQVQAIAELEKRRLSLMGELTQLVKRDAAQPFDVQTLAEHLPEPARTRLLLLRAQLRARAEATRKDLKSIHAATEVLLRHMQGLMQSIGGLVTGVNTYGRNGQLPHAAMAVNTFNATA